MGVTATLRHLSVDCPRCLWFGIRGVHRPERPSPTFLRKQTSAAGSALAGALTPADRHDAPAFLERKTSLRMRSKSGGPPDRGQGGMYRPQRHPGGSLTSCAGGRPRLHPEPQRAESA
jgi:hypothetical protein